jgi:hypothetical protein
MQNMSGFVPLRALRGKNKQIRALPNRGGRQVKAREQGQSAIIIALALPFLMAFALMVIEVAERWLEVAMIEDALQQAARSAVQRLDYADLAQNRGEMAATRDCRQVNWSQDSACRAILGEARRLLLINLGNVRGLAETPDALAERVRWTVLPQGGSCTFRRSSRNVSERTPLLCAEVAPRMRGIVGWGTFTPLIAAAETLDPIGR